MREQGDIVVNVPGVDYYTGTTFTPSDWRNWVKQFQGTVEESPKPRNIGGYKGYQLPGVFYGQGSQGELAHYILTLSGAMADNLFPSTSTNFTTKRLDLQVTIDLPEWYKHRALVHSLRNGQWKGRRLTVGLREDGKGGSTVYIGSMASDKLIRVYVKSKSYLRYEIQYRREYAESAAEHVREGGRMAIGEILGEQSLKFPRHPVWDDFRAVLGQGRVVASYTANPEKANRMKWLASLLNTIQRMANDHDYGDTVVNWLQEIIDNASRSKE